MPQIPIYDVDAFKRRLITPENLAEIGITTSLVQSILSANLATLKRVVVDENKRPVLDAKNKQISIWPDGLSINETIFGNFSGPTAAALGWMAYLDIGAPLIEERANIFQPPADVLSTRSYENRALVERQFTDTIEFTIGNTINWSLTGASDFTFAGKVSGELQSQLSNTLEQSLAHSLATSIANASTKSRTTTEIMHAHKDNMGTESQSANQESTTNTTTTTTTDTDTFRGSFTGTGSATGAGELLTQLMLSITGSISGTLTTSWGSSSTVSGSIPAGSRVETMATQRRQVKQYTYELPITFGGFIALHYAELVLPFGDAYSPQLNTAPPDNVIAREINALGLVKNGEYFRPMGVAETVSALEVNHIIFEKKAIIIDSTQTFGNKRPHNL